MRRITLVALAVFVIAAAAASCIASDGIQPLGNAAAVASGVAFDKESVKQAVAATQAVGLPSNPAARQIRIGLPPAAQKEVTAAAPSAAQAPPACPPAIDQAALKQMLLPALESALKEIRAEMTGAQKPSAQPAPAAPEVKAAPAPKPEVKAAPTPKPEVKAVPAPKPEVKAAPVPKPQAGLQVWPAVPATGRAELVAAAPAPTAGAAAVEKSVAKPTAAANSAPADPASGQCASCDRERVAPLPEPVQGPAQVKPQAANSAPAPATTAAAVNPTAAVQPPMPRTGQVVVSNQALEQVAKMLQAQGSYTPGGGVTSSPAAQAAWAQTPPSQGVTVPTVGTQPKAPR